MYFDVLNTNMTMKICVNDIFKVKRTKKPNIAKTWNQTKISYNRVGSARNARLEKTNLNKPEKTNRNKAKTHKQS